MAKQLIATAETADHDFAIWVINPDFSPSLYTFTVASWNIDYRALDDNNPGFLPSVCTVSALINDDDFSLNLRNILQDANGRYMIKITEGINVVYVGFITPDLGEIEVINGQRFIKLVASDGFQMLNETSSIYDFTGTGVKPFATQIYEILDFYNFWDVYDAFAVSEHPEPNSLPDTTKGGLYWTGCIQNGLYFKDTDWRTFRQVMDDILLTFGLQCFQDKGLLVFRSVWYKTPAWYNFYGLQGAFLYRLTGYSTTDTANVFAEGTELFKAATRQVFITHNQTGSTYIKDEGLTYKSRTNYYVANAIPTGTNKIRYSAGLQITSGVPAGYDDHPEVEWDVSIRFGPYYYNGSSWTKTFSTLTYSDQKHVVGDISLPTITVFTHAVNNLDTAILPNIGSQPIYITVTGQQVAGAALDSTVVDSTLLMEYNSGTPTETVYYADNTKRRNGVDQSFDTTIGDLFQTSAIATPSAGELRKFIDTARTSSSTNLQWDTAKNLLLTKNSIEMAKKAYQPQQYYEIELDKTVTYNHKFTWSSVDYKPLNLSFDEKSTKVTYRQWVDGDLETDPNNGRPDQLLPPL